MTSRDLSNVDIVLFSLLKLGGSTEKIHTESLAWDAYQTSKEKFSWSLPEFIKREFPDKTTARYALESAKKMGLVKGRAGKDKGGAEKEGWQLTPKGVEWILKNEKRISTSLNIKTISQSIPIDKAKRIIRDIRSHRTFTKFKRDGSLVAVNKYDLIDLLNCSPDASAKVIKIKFDLLKNAINLTRDSELKQFISKIERKFPKILSKKGLKT